jgi:hypothetical protein
LINFFLRFPKNPLVAINVWKEKYEKIFRYYLGLQPILVVTDLELLKLILVKDFHNFIDRGVNNFLINCISKIKVKEGKNFRSDIV